jgi:hypothetical protein
MGRLDALGQSSSHALEKCKALGRSKLQQSCRARRRGLLARSGANATRGTGFANVSMGFDGLFRARLGGSSQILIRDLFAGRTCPPFSSDPNHSIGDGLTGRLASAVLPPKGERVASHDPPARPLFFSSITWQTIRHAHSCALGRSRIPSARRQIPAASRRAGRYPVCCRRLLRRDHAFRRRRELPLVYGDAHFVPAAS